MRAAPRLFLGLFAAVAASLGVTASASAALSLGPIDLGATVTNVVKLNVLGTCGDQDSAAVFRPWGDFSQYVLAPNGDFATAGDWDLSGDAQLVTTASPRGNGRVLSLGDDGEAVSPITCLSVVHPTIRLFARNAGAAGSRLEVTVLMRGSNGTFTELPVSTLTAGSSLQGRRHRREGREVAARRVLRRPLQGALSAPHPPKMRPASSGVRVSGFKGVLTQADRGLDAATPAGRQCG
jgi:hypothetical protein